MGLWCNNALYLGHYPFLVRLQVHQFNIPQFFKGGIHEMSATMQAMIAYSTAMLQALSDWLSAEPMLYLFAMVLGAFVINTIMSLIHIGGK